MAVSIINMLLVFLVILTLMPVALNFANAFVPSTNATAIGFSSLYANTSASWSNSVIQPLVGNPSLSGNGINASAYIIHGLNYTANPFASSAQLGFSFAFIVPNTIAVMETMLSMPLTIGRFIDVAVGIIAPSMPANTINSISLTIVGFLYLVIAFVFFSVVSKYPVLQG